MSVSNNDTEQMAAMMNQLIADAVKAESQRARYDTLTLHTLHVKCHRAPAPNTVRRRCWDEAEGPAAECIFWPRIYGAYGALRGKIARQPPNSLHSVWDAAVAVKTPKRKGFRQSTLADACAKKARKKD